MSGKHPLVQAVENAQLKQDIPAFAPGDTVIVQVKVKEGDRERLQAFEGVVILRSPPDILKKEINAFADV